jgi:uncharacterized RDD family membrane protein YckC
MSLQTAIECAAWWRRAAAVTLDGAITLGAALAAAEWIGPRDFMQRGDGFLLWWMLLGGAYMTVFTGMPRGQTVGKVLLGIRVVSADGSQLGFGRAFGRWLMTGVFWMLGVWIGGIVDSLAALFDAQRRTLHDRMVNSIVVCSAA